MSQSAVRRHRGPEVGYNSFAKQAYRKSVWNCMATAIIEANEFAPDSKQGHILILPGLTCKEVDVAIRAGLRKDRIVLVHESQWHIDNEAEWRIKHPDIKYYAGMLSELIVEFKRDGIQFVGANLDMCGNFSAEMVEQYSAFCDYCDSVKSPSPVTIGLTMMKGREQTALVKILERLSTRNQPLGLAEKRLEVMMREFGLQDVTQHISCIGEQTTRRTVLGEDAYIHNKAPMAWAVVEYLQPSAWESRLLRGCDREASAIAKQMFKLERHALWVEKIRKWENWETISEADWIKVAVIAREVSAIGEKICPGWRAVEDMPPSLKEYYRLTEGYKSGKKPLDKRFLSTEDYSKFSSIKRHGDSIWDVKDAEPTRCYVPKHLQVNLETMFAKVEATELADIRIRVTTAKSPEAKLIGVPKLNEKEATWYKYYNSILNKIKARVQKKKPISDSMFRELRSGRSVLQVCHAWPDEYFAHGMPPDINLLVESYWAAQDAEKERLQGVREKVIEIVGPTGQYYRTELVCPVIARAVYKEFMLSGVSTKLLRRKGLLHAANEAAYTQFVLDEGNSLVA